MINKFFFAKQLNSFFLQTIEVYSKLVQVQTKVCNIFKCSQVFSSTFSLLIVFSFGFGTGTYALGALHNAHPLKARYIYTKNLVCQQREWWSFIPTFRMLRFENIQNRPKYPVFARAVTCATLHTHFRYRYSCWFEVYSSIILFNYRTSKGPNMVDAVQWNVVTITSHEQFATYCSIRMVLMQRQRHILAVQLFILAN